MHVAAVKRKQFSKMISYLRVAANYVAWSTMFSSTLQYLLCLININRTARSVIEIIRRNGVVPATIAVLNGELHIGEDTASCAFSWKTRVRHQLSDLISHFKRSDKK